MEMCGVCGRIERCADFWSECHFRYSSLRLAACGRNKIIMNNDNNRCPSVRVCDFLFSLFLRVFISRWPSCICSEVCGISIPSFRNTNNRIDTDSYQSFPCGLTSALIVLFRAYGKISTRFPFNWSNYYIFLPLDSRHSKPKSRGILYLKCSN